MHEDRVYFLFNYKAGKLDFRLKTNDIEFFIKKTVCEVVHSHMHRSRHQSKAKEITRLYSAKNEKLKNS